MQPKAVMFDAGGTLIEAFPSVGDVYSRVAHRFGSVEEPALLNQSFRSAWKSELHKNNKVDSAFWLRVVKKTFEPVGATVPENLFLDIYQEFKKPDVWRIFQDVTPTLARLRKENIIIAVASNWDERLPELLKKLNLDSYFDEQFISYEMGTAKPDPEFFKKCLSRLNLPSSDVIHIGDDEENDVRGPTLVGIRSFLIDRKGNENKGDEMLGSLEEIFKRF